MAVRLPYASAAAFSAARACSSSSAWLSAILKKGYQMTQLICLAAAVLIYIPCVRVHEANQNNSDAKLAEAE